MYACVCYRADENCSAPLFRNPEQSRKRKERQPTLAALETRCDFRLKFNFLFPLPFLQILYYIFTLTHTHACSHTHTVGIAAHFRIFFFRSSPVCFLFLRINSCFTQNFPKDVPPDPASPSHGRPWKTRWAVGERV